jgi:hypothetical protein
MPREGGAPSSPCALCKTHAVPKLESRGYWVARRTDGRISFRDQHSSFANMVSGKLLLPGGIVGAGMVVVNIVTIVLYEGRVGSQLCVSVFNTVIGIFLMSYFIYLSALKREQRKAN